jgi:hypothetical protein
MTQLIIVGYLVCVNVVVYPSRTSDKVSLTVPYNCWYIDVLLVRCLYAFICICMLIVSHKSFKNGIYMCFTCNTQVYVPCIMDGET